MGIKAEVLYGSSELEIHALHMLTTTTTANTWLHTYRVQTFTRFFESNTEKLQMTSTTQTPEAMTTELQQHYSQHIYYVELLETQAQTDTRKLFNARASLYPTHQHQQPIRAACACLTLPFRNAIANSQSSNSSKQPANSNNQPQCVGSKASAALGR